MIFEVFVQTLIPWIVLLGMALAFSLLVLFILTFTRAHSSVSAVHGFVRLYGVAIAGFVALTATAGSLFYSEVLGFFPCPLCWYQRILMYPLVLLFGVALFLGKRDVYKYALSLAVPGFVVAVYHYLVQVYQITTACIAPGGRELVEEAGQCTMRFVFDFGFLSIPFMAAVAFLMIILISLLALRKPRTSGSHEER